VFANPVAPPRVLPPRDILRFLRLITSPAYRDDKRVPLSAIATMCGVNRMALYRVVWSGQVSEEVAEVLTPIVRAFEAGKLKFRWSGPRSEMRNRWEVVETQPPPAARSCG
jgi:hypothetical protein